MKQKRQTKDGSNVTKTRASIDRFVFDLYYQLYDGPKQAILNKTLEYHSIDDTIIKDLRTLGYIESAGNKRGQITAWIGPYPDETTSEAIEKLRKKRVADRKKVKVVTKEQMVLEVDKALDARNVIDRWLDSINAKWRLF